MEEVANARIGGLLGAGSEGREEQARNAAEALAAFERAADGRHRRLYAAARELLLEVLERGRPSAPTKPGSF